jgi:adenosylhomocysteinase
MRARRMGVRVTVVEVDPIKAIEAHLEGFEVSDILQAALKGELIITATGQKSAVPYEAIEWMP